jgi:hypothetical protein
MRARSPARTALARARLATLAFVVLLAGATPIGAEVFCNARGADPRTELKPTKALPWAAVGYLDNGCTATLISQRWVLAAAHCFYGSGDGTGWQQGLGFVPNFHPSQPKVSHAVDRAVVGTRLPTAAPEHLDWGIGHLSTPVTDYPPLTIGDAPAAPFRAASAGYARDRAWFAPGSGNTWWTPALIDPDCLVRASKGLDSVTQTNRENYLITTCAAVGGNSGSPIVQALDGRQAQYRVIGVISGSARRDFSGSKLSCAPYSPTLPQSALNYGPAAQRFRYAPFRATGVAVTPVAASVKRTRVFVADDGASRIVRRERTSSSSTDGFSTYAFDTFLPSPSTITGFVQGNGNPGLAATSNGRLFVRLATGPDEWALWEELDRPGGTQAVIDVDALEGGASEIYALSDDGRPYARRLEGTTWSAWRALKGGGYRRIAAVKRADGRRLVVTVNTKGKPSLHRQTGSSWTSAFKSPEPFGSPHGLIEEVDAVTDRAGITRVFATGANSQWTREMVSKTGGAWLDWRAWDVRLLTFGDSFRKKATSAARNGNYWQHTTGPRLGGIVGLSATRWVESSGAAHSGTVVFAVDSRGNVYSTEPRCPGSQPFGNCFPGYWTGWKPFTE